MKIVSGVIIFLLILMGPAVWAGKGNWKDTAALENGQEDIIGRNVEEGPTDADFEPEFEEDDETTWNVEEGATDADLEEPDYDQ